VALVLSRIVLRGRLADPDGTFAPTGPLFRKMDSLSKASAEAVVRAAFTGLHLGELV
jgi:hypothetical protein